MKTNKKIKIFYHIFLEKNWNKIVEEQIKTLVNSGILNFSEFNVGVVYGYGYDKENGLNLLNEILKEIDHKIIYVEPTGCCGESSTLVRLKEYCDSLIDNENILYFHSKGITQIDTIREKPVSEWRKMMEYFLIENWEDCIDKLNEGYDCCGINYQDHAANVKNQIVGIKIFNGNFFWAQSDYLKKLEKNILLEHRYSAENWILSEEHNAYSFLNVPPSFDLYYNIYENYK